MTMTEYNLIGKSPPQIHAWDKVTGRAKYTDDLRIQRPLIIKILRSPHASASILSLNVEQAALMPGVRGTLVGSEIKNTFGVLPISKDEPAMGQTCVRYVGEPVAAVAAETEAQAISALEKIEVEYKITQAILTSEQALKETREQIHPELKKANNLHKRVEQNFGNVSEGFTAAEAVVEGDFEFSSVTHAFTEPHATQVEIDGQGNVTVYSATQVPHYLHRALHEVLEIPMHQIRVIKPHLGGGFGGKSDPFPHEMIATKLALKTGRNTRLTFTREEVFFSHHGRHPTKIKMKMGLANVKGITALEGKMLIDGGAYGSFGVVTSYYNGVLLQGPYRIENFAFECQRVYTNHPMCGAMRGHGGVNPRFASEVLIDEGCTKLGLDPCEFRLKNLHQAYTLAPNQFRITSQGLTKGLTRAMEKGQWKNKFGKLPFGQGIGVACGFFISGSALPIHWNEMPQSKVRLTLDYDGGVTVYSGASDLGQGSDTMLAQIVGEVLGLPMNMIKVISADTRLTPIDLGSYSSRVTFMAGNAAKNAAVSMRRILGKAACELWKIAEIK
ncbi:MAG: molybdopterin cofactor-binding domain-containing protein, partial [Bdellovibrionota bacterium]